MTRERRVQLGSREVAVRAGGVDTQRYRVLLLHGMGANGAVWEGLCNVIEADDDYSWIAPDLRGHGGSAWAGAYSFGAMAEDTAELLHVLFEGSPPRVGIIGHSMGGVVGLALSSGWFGVEVDAVVCAGVKVRWSREDLERMDKVAQRGPMIFESREEAVERFLRVSGLSGLVSEDSAVVRAGVRATDEGFCVAWDPKSASVGPPMMTELLAASRSSAVVLARGETDEMVTLQELRSYQAQALEFAGVGHNPHVEAPASLWKASQQVMHAG